MCLKAMTAGFAFISMLATVAFTPVWAGEREEVESLRDTTLNLINLLVEEKVLSREKADELIAKAQARQDGHVGEKTDSAPVRVQYVPEPVKKEIREQIRQEVITQAMTERWGEPNAVPEWLDRIKWEGDLRLRYQHDGFAASNETFTNLNSYYGFNNTDASALTNSTEARSRMRLRARLGMLAKVGDTVSAGLRLATGSTSDPVSTNQTMGNTGNKYTFLLDRAYFKWTPAEWATLWGGRLPNPWFGTDLVWDDDLNFEGVAMSLTRPGENLDFRPSLTVGAFPLQEVELSQNDKWLYGTQLGFEWDRNSRTRFKFGLGYYDYRHTVGQRNAVGLNLLDYTAPRFRQKGNTMFDIDDTGANPLWALAADYQEANLTASVDLAQFDPVHVILTGDYVRNVGYDAAKVNQLTGLAAWEAKTTGYQAVLAVGMPRIERYRDWQVSLAYKYLERDAVLDAFTDSDFRLGGTDAKGYILKGVYGIDRNTWLELRLLSAREIDGPPFSVDVMQLDFGAKF